MQSKKRCNLCSTSLLRRTYNKHIYTFRSSKFLTGIVFLHKLKKKIFCEAGQVFITFSTHKIVPLRESSYSEIAKSDKHLLQNNDHSLMHSTLTYRCLVSEGFLY